MDSIHELQAAKQRLESKFAKGGATDETRNLYRDIAGQIAELELSLPQASLTNMGDGALLNRGHSGGPFPTFGQQLVSVMRAAIPGGQVDPKLHQIQGAATGLNETVPSDGGFLVQQDFSTALLQSIYETGVLAARCNQIPISGNANGINLPRPDETSRATGSRWGGIRGYWADEASEKTPSKPKFSNMELKLKKLIGLCYATDELLEDAAVLETVITQGFSDEFGFLIDDALVNGNGAGMPLGVLNAGCLVTQDKEVGQAAKTVVIENLVRMFSRMPARNRRNAAWFINQEVEPQLFTMSLAVGTGGGPVYLPSGGASEAPYATLLGRPVIPIEQASALGDLGDVLFADYGSYVLAEKGGIKSDMSINVRFIHDESVFRFVLRVDGQPSLASAITPYKGASDLSPFVTLEAR